MSEDEDDEEESEDEEERELVGTPCPVPNCQGFVKYNEEDELVCDFGHILTWEQIKK